jgi:DNA-binding NarL/FixJ family response regulator
MRVLVYTDEPVLAEGYRCVLAPAGLELILCEKLETLYAEAGKEADVILLSFHTSLRAEVVSELRRRHPESKIALSVERVSLEMAYEALECGVRGIFSKTLPPAMLAEALGRVAEGEIYFQCPATASVFHRQKRLLLTARERELMRLVGEGMKNKEIATAMNITEGSVKTYLSRLFRRLGTRNRFDLARYSRENLDAAPTGRQTPAQTDDAGKQQVELQNEYQHV